MSSTILNTVLFPAPKPPHYTKESHINNLFWIPATSPSDAPIPCMFYFPHNRGIRIEYLMIFCHGNGCDIGSMQYTLSTFATALNMYILSFEYPGYGLCPATSPSQKTINNHAERTFAFVRDAFQWPTERILLYGHSIGSGAACHLASTQPIAALILQSPYTAIRDLIREKAGIFSFFVSGQSWDNLEAMKAIKCPVLFIHGQDDTLIPFNHSETLHDACTNTQGKKLVLLPKEDHNSMSETTLLKYITPFLSKQYTQLNVNLPLPPIEINAALREQPEMASKTASSQTGIVNSLLSMSKASTAATASVGRKLRGKQTDQTDEQ